MQTHIDLFTGIAGFSIAAQRNGFRTVAMCEKDERCRDFLGKAWPGIPIFDDINSFPAEQYFGATLVTAGVPCQPASRAGKQRGEEDDRWLWPHAIEVIGHIKPTWAVLENPPGIGDVGLSGILSNLEEEGYETRVFDIPACAVNAPHRRHRYWIIACNALVFANGYGCESRNEAAEDARHGSSIKSANSGSVDNAESHGCEAGAPLYAEYDRQGLGERYIAGYMANPGCVGSRKDQPEREPQRRDADWWISAPDMAHASSTGLEVAASQSSNHQPEQSAIERGGVCGWQDYIWMPCADAKLRRAPSDAFGLVDGLPVELFEALAEGEEAQPHRSLIAALGNSIVWRVADEIIRVIAQVEDEYSRPDPIRAARY